MKTEQEENNDSGRWAIALPVGGINFAQGKYVRRACFLVNAQQPERRPGVSVLLAAATLSISFTHGLRRTF